MFLRDSNRLADNLQVYVRLTGFMVIKLSVGEILQYLVWYNEGHLPFYVTCRKCKHKWVIKIESDHVPYLWDGRVKANCPHPGQIGFVIQPGENGYMVQHYWLESSLREVYGHNSNCLVDRQITDFC